MCIDRAKLLAPFDNIRNRRGQAGKTFDYIPSEDMLERVIDATEGQYGWTVVTIEFRAGYTTEKWDDRAQAMRPVVKAAYWMVHGRLDIPGLGVYDGIGTALDENEDGVKGAETDAFKRALLKTGVGIDIYKSRREPAAMAREEGRGKREQSQGPGARGQGPGAKPEVNGGLATAAQLNAIRAIAAETHLAVDDVDSFSFEQASNFIREFGSRRRRNAA